MKGIYRIINTANNMSYVGRTTDFEKRFKEHKAALRNNKHYNKELQRDFNKFGVDSFSYLILESLENMNISREKESEYINLFRKGGTYNIFDPNLEHIPAIDSYTTIYDSIPKEFEGKCSYDIVKRNTQRVASGFLKDMESITLEKQGFVFWDFNQLFYSIHSQLDFYTKDIRYMLALKEVIEESGLQVVAPGRYRKLHKFIPSDVESYIIVSKKTMNGIIYKYKETLELHETFKIEQKKKKEERLRKEASKKELEMQEQKKTIAKLENDIKTIKEKNKLMPKGDGSFSDAIKIRILEKGTPVEKIIGSEINKNKGYTFYEVLIDRLQKEGVFNTYEITNEEAKVKTFLRLTFSLKIKEIRTSIEELEISKISIKKNHIKERENDVIVYYKK